MASDSVAHLFLVVDDNIINIQVLGEMLSKAGFRVAVAKSGVEALKRLEVITPALIFMDIKMPHMNGFECCRKIRDNKATAHIPLVFLSAANDEDTIREAEEAGGSSFLAKPVEQSQLLATIKNHLSI